MQHFFLRSCFDASLVWLRFYQSLYVSNSVWFTFLALDGRLAFYLNRGALREAVGALDQFFISNVPGLSFEERHSSYSPPNPLQLHEERGLSIALLGCLKIFD